MYQVRRKTISNYSRFYKDAGCSYLVTTNNAKTLKGEGYLTSIFHLSPHTLAGVVVDGKRVSVCERATPECIGACLNSSGHTEMRMNKLGVNSDPARDARTKLLFSDPDKFKELAVRELDANARKAKREGLIHVIRPNGTSDIKWEEVFPELFGQFPQVYDYTKYDPDERTEKLLTDGHRVAKVFGLLKGQPLPDTWRGFKVLDGDLDDLTFTKPRGVVLGLRIKGQRNRAKLKLGKLKLGGFIAAA
jgi:hypothetical protein